MTAGNLRKQTDKAIPDSARALRDAFGCFATGITVVTSTRTDGTPIGFTCNSFSSVSLSPPLVSWCLANTSGSLAAFLEAEHYAVNVLAHDQEQISRSFCRPFADRFEGIEYEISPRGSPILSGTVAYFECASKHRYEGGDHVMFVGEVVDFLMSRKDPLLFSRGQYSRLAMANATVQEMQDF